AISPFLVVSDRLRVAASTCNERFLAHQAWLEADDRLAQDHSLQKQHRTDSDHEIRPTHPVMRGRVASQIANRQTGTRRQRPRTLQEWAGILVRMEFHGQAHPSTRIDRSTRSFIKHRERIEFVKSIRRVTAISDVL